MVLLTELLARIQHYEKAILKPSLKASFLKQPVSRLIDTYDDAVREFRETGRVSPQFCLLSAEQLKRLFQSAKEDVRNKMVQRFAKNLPAETAELK